MGLLVESNSVENSGVGVSESSDNGSVSDLSVPHEMDWSPFWVDSSGEPVLSPRPLETPDGISDRLRSAAFAELQAREAFLWAARTFEDASEPLKSAWIQLADAEDRHLGWLLARLKELGYDVRERAVSNRLWGSLIACQTAHEFAHYMASAELRGQKAGMRFHRVLCKKDPKTADIFLKIAQEETEHIALAQKFFPEG